MEIKTKNEAVLIFDEKQWMISPSTECEVVNSENEYLTLINVNGILTIIHKSVLIDNHIDIEQNRIVLGDILYQHYIIEPFRELSNRNFNELFYKDHPQIFAKKEIIINNAEYYLLKPDALKSYIGSPIEFPLGFIIESIIDKTIPIAKDVKNDKEYFIIAATLPPWGSGTGKQITCLDTDTNIITRVELNSVEFSMSEVVDYFKNNNQIYPKIENLLEEKSIRSLIANIIFS